MKTKTIISLLIIIFCSCMQAGIKTIDSRGNMCQDTIGQIVFNVKDTTSNLYISGRECTECLDAGVDSGIVYIPDSVIAKIKKIEKEKGSGYIPNGHDLYLTGQEKITEILFGDSSNYMQHWHDNYLITGKAIDVISGVNGTGILFRVDSYEKITRK